MAQNKLDPKQDKLLTDILALLKGYIFEPGNTDDQDFNDQMFQASALQVASVSSFLAGYVDGICSLAQVDRQKRQLISDKMFGHGKSFALSEIRKDARIRSKLWSELNPS